RAASGSLVVGAWLALQSHRYGVAPGSRRSQPRKSAAHHGYLPFARYRSQREYGLAQRMHANLLRPARLPHGPDRRSQQFGGMTVLPARSASKGIPLFALRAGKRYAYFKWTFDNLILRDSNLPAIALTVSVSFGKSKAPMRCQL